MILETALSETKTRRTYGYPCLTMGLATESDINRASVFSGFNYPELPELPDRAPDRVPADLKHIYALRMKLILYV